jgi:large subunit ribosomal protein L21
MYAVIKTGGKQYRVTPGQTFRVERIEGELGESVTLNDVLLFSDGESVKVGKPLLDGATVTAQIVEQHRAKKVMIFKKRRRKAYRLTKGHRQYYTALRVQEINA